MSKYENLIYNYIISSLDRELALNQNVVSLDVSRRVLVHLGLEKRDDNKYLSYEINKLVKKHLSKLTVPFKFDRSSGSWKLLVGGTFWDYIKFKYFSIYA